MLVSGLAGRRRPVLVVGDVGTPRRAVTVVVGLYHRDVGQEVGGGRTVPVPLTRRRVDHLTGADLANLAAAGLHPPAAFGHVQRLADGMRVPGGAGTWCEVDEVDAQAGGLGALRDAVQPDVPGELLRRSFDSRWLGLNLHCVTPLVAYIHRSSQKPM